MLRITSRLASALARRDVAAARMRAAEPRQPSIAGDGRRHAVQAPADRRQRATSMRLAQGRDRDELEPVDDRRRGARRAARDDRPLEPEPGRLAQPPLEPGRPGAARRAGPTSPIATVPRRDRPVAQRRGEGQRERQVEAGLVDGSGRRRGWRRRRGCRGRSRPAGRGRRRAARAGSGRCRCAVRRGRAVAGRARRAPGPRPAAAGCPRGSARRRCPGAGPSCSTRKARAGSATSRRPELAHLEDADLLGRAEAVLRGAQEAQRARSARPRGRGPRRRGARASWARRSSRPS